MSTCKFGSPGVIDLCALRLGDSVGSLGLIGALDLFGDLGGFKGVSMLSKVVDLSIQLNEWEVLE